jgi:hypothetical protein
MTESEHLLILEMLNRQTLLIAGLVEALKSQGALTQGDLQAFVAVVSPSRRQSLERYMEADYLV